MDAVPANVPSSSEHFEALYTNVTPTLYAWAELRIRPSLRARLEPQDLVQEVWLRWQGTDRSVVLDPTAFLVTTASRLSINSRS